MNTIKWIRPDFREEAGEYFENDAARQWLGEKGVTVDTEQDLVDILRAGHEKVMGREDLPTSQNLTLSDEGFAEELKLPGYSDSYRSMEDALGKGPLTLESPIVLDVGGKLWGFSGNRRMNLAWRHGIPVKFWVVPVKEVNMERKADYPDHPDDTVLPGGEWNHKAYTEVDVWNYYSGVKGKMLSELKGRNMFIGIVPKGYKAGTKPVYVRHPYRGEGDYIHIGGDNDFETYHSGRTVEYHVTMPQQAPYYIVDIDAPGPFDETKKIVGDVADALGRVGDVKNVEIRYSGKRGFHILGWLKKAQDVNDARTFLHGWLKDTFGGRKDVVFGESPVGDKPALGLSPMKVNGGQVALWSMRPTGLCCVEVPRAELGAFEREDATVEKVYKKATGRDFEFGAKNKMAARVKALFVNAQARDIVGAEGVVTDVTRRITATYDTQAFQAGYKGKFVIQEHIADKAGPHFDVRFEWPVKNVARALGVYGRKGRGEDEPAGVGENAPGTVYRSFVDKKRRLPEGDEKIYLVETENHPIEYGKFQGEITEGYGKGHVKIWDRGRFTLLDAGKDRYVMEFDGGKLSGTYALVHYKEGFLWVKSKDRKASAGAVVSGYMSGRETIWEG